MPKLTKREMKTLVRALWDSMQWTLGLLDAYRDRSTQTGYMLGHAAKCRRWEREIVRRNELKNKIRAELEEGKRDVNSPH